MKITSRDQKLLKCLASYGMMSTGQIRDHLFNNIATTTVLRRLRLLEKANHLKRILGLEGHELLWSLAPYGARTVKVIMPKRHWSKNMLEHDFRLISLRLAMEGCGIAHSWLPEHEIRSTIFKKYGFRGIKERVVPDGLMVVEVNGRKVSVAIELELTLKNKTRLRRTLMRYLEKSELHAVWYVSPSMSILKSVYRQWQICGGEKSGIDFYGSVLSEVLDCPLKAKLRGKKALSIGESWNIRSNFLPARRVSRCEEAVEELKPKLTEENHEVLLDRAS